MISIAFLSPGTIRDNTSSRPRPLPNPFKMVTHASSRMSHPTIRLYVKQILTASYGDPQKNRGRGNRRRLRLKNWYALTAELHRVINPEDRCLHVSKLFV
jgi:hypothetical protein